MQHFFLKSLNYFAEVHLKRLHVQCSMFAILTFHAFLIIARPDIELFIFGFYEHNFIFP